SAATASLPFAAPTILTAPLTEDPSPPSKRILPESIFARRSGAKRFRTEAVNSGSVSSRCAAHPTHIKIARIAGKARIARLDHDAGKSLTTGFPVPDDGP